MNSTCELTVDLRNSSSLLPFLYLPNEWILFEIVWPSIILIGLTGNVVFISTVKRVPSLHTSTFIFLASLALTDLVVLLGIGLDYLLDYVMSPTRYGDQFLVSMVFFFVTWFCFVSSIFFVTLVSAERYFAICHPIRHHLLKGTKRTIKLICIVLLGSFVFSSVILPPMVVKAVVVCIKWPLNSKFANSYPHLVKLLPSDYFVPDDRVMSQIMLVVSVSSIVFALVANFNLYIRIVQTLRKRSCNKNLQTSADLERNIRQVSVMVIANGMIFYLCFLVFLVNISLHLMISFQLEIMNAYQRIIWDDVNYTFVLINASINPLVYFITNQSYRHALKKSMRMCLRQRSYNSNATGHMSQTGPKKCFIPQNCRKYTNFD